MNNGAFSVAVLVCSVGINGAWLVAWDFLRACADPLFRAVASPFHPLVATPGSVMQFSFPKRYRGVFRLQLLSPVLYIHGGLQQGEYRKDRTHNLKVISAPHTRVIEGIPSEELRYALSRC